MASSGIYNIFKANLMNKVVDLEVDTIKVALMGSTHDFTAADTAYITDNELAAAGEYTQGGYTLTAMTVAGTTTVAWDAEDAAWAGATFTAYGALVYDSTTADNPICTIDFGGAKTVAAGTFTIEWDAAGIITLATA